MKFVTDIIVRISKDYKKETDYKPSNGILRHLDKLHPSGVQVEVEALNSLRCKVDFDCSSAQRNQDLMKAVGEWKMKTVERGRASAYEAFIPKVLLKGEAGQSKEFFSFFDVLFLDSTLARKKQKTALRWTKGPSMASSLEAYIKKQGKKLLQTEFKQLLPTYCEMLKAQKLGFKFEKQLWAVDNTVASRLAECFAVKHIFLKDVFETSLAVDVEQEMMMFVALHPHVLLKGSPKTTTTTSTVKEHATTTTTTATTTITNKFNSAMLTFMAGIWKDEWKSASSEDKKHVCGKFVNDLEHQPTGWWTKTTTMQPDEQQVCNHLLEVMAPAKTDAKCETLRGNAYCGGTKCLNQWWDFMGFFCGNAEY